MVGVQPTTTVGNVKSVGGSPVSEESSLTRSLWFGKEGSWAMAEGRIFGGSSRILGGFSGC